MVRKSTKKDIPALLDIFSEARERMYESGNTKQWGPGYPPLDALEKEVEKGFSYIIEENEIPIATFSIMTGKEPTYSYIFDGSWPIGEYEYVTIHRVAGKRKAHHVLKTAVAEAEKLSRIIRIDTHQDNKKMQALIKRYGFSYCGKIYLEDGSERLAFQKGKI